MLTGYDCLGVVIILAAKIVPDGIMERGFAISEAVDPGYQNVSAQEGINL